MWKQKKFTVNELTQVGEVRRYAQSLANEEGFNETLAGKISIVVTELSTNLVKHAGGGDIIITHIEKCLHVLALDKGKGMMNLSECLADGFSTRGTAGTGLGAIRRGAQAFDIYSRPGKGTAVYVNFEQTSKTHHHFRTGAVAIPYKNEAVSGDAWSKNPERTRYMLVDGLGHGLLAHEAARAAQETFAETHNLTLDQQMERLHLALRSTRGGAISLAEIDSDKGVLTFCGVGNVLGTIVGPESTKRCISYPGTVGVQMRKFQTLPYPIKADSDVFIMASDGLSTHWTLKDYPGLLQKDPYLIAGVLYRDFGKATDDVTVLVVKGQQ